MATEIDAVGRKAFQGEIASLCDEFRGVFGPETIERYVSESIDRMEGARLTDFLPLFVHRFARQRLRALAQVEGQITKEVPEVEAGVDLEQEFPKPLTDEFVQAADAVITMGCGDACPIYPGKRYEDWDLDDPAGKDLQAVRAIRGQIEVRVRRLLDELVEGAGGAST